ncbi:MAG: type II toxin-antitoxin system Phd/YefM family antitoxin [Clostridia bacterium]|nr:type II toxin-antitoxin system Phd/YefM family antitoxin [Clostridia bacterium]MBR0407959.1 type II toxin-antitoxin system Phd/YefM family antitoxin [Clostridia bacterium]
MMTIRPSTALRNEYADISRVCHETGEPVFITRNGEGDLVVQSVAAYNQREMSLELREKLLEAEEQLASGVQPVSVERAAEKWRAVIDAAGTR